MLACPTQLARHYRILVLPNVMLLFLANFLRMLALLR
jgi:hypothetical protein